jgi:hypothetical protein
VLAFHVCQTDPGGAGRRPVITAEDQQGSSAEHSLRLPVTMTNAVRTIFREFNVGLRVCVAGGTSTSREKKREIRISCKSLAAGG